MFRITRVPVVRKADSLIDAAVGHLINAAETAALAVEHATKTMLHHEAELAYHRDAHATAVSVLDEAKTVVSDVKNLLGEGEHVAAEVAPVVAAAETVAQEVK